MNDKKKSEQSSNFKWRRIVHFALIASILIIQLLVVGFFYNEFLQEKKIQVIENKLDDVQQLDSLTLEARKNFIDANTALQEFFVNENQQYLESYFTSLKKLGDKLDFLDKSKHLNLELQQFSKNDEIKNWSLDRMKTLLDSTYQYSSHKDFNVKVDVKKITPVLKKFNFDHNFDKYDIDTRTFTDSTKKKGLFGRLGDAISGKETVRKDSTVILMKQVGKTNSERIKLEVDSIVNSANNYYSNEVQKIIQTKTETKKEDKSFYRIFNNLLTYSNGLMQVYESAIDQSKASLENEKEQQESQNSRIRNNIIFGAMLLMFIVSILIMYLTRISFIYEQRLNRANKLISENLNFKNRILGMLSHELRSPLKIIGIFINRINKKTSDDTIKDYLKSISFTNNTLLMQANQILEYTKNQQVENKLNPVVFNLNNEVSAILTAIAPYIETRNNTFVVQQDIDENLFVFTDNTKINQIFMNILGNDNKFTENGHIMVKTKAEQTSAKIITLSTEIIDNGVGISKADLRNIFEPYYQGILSENVENLGAGLGLSLCKEIIELYDGRISVHSEIDKGTSVKFSLNLNAYEPSRS